jgi:hypothetical protein
MSRTKRVKVDSLSDLAKTEFQPIEELAGWEGATHAEWCVTSERMRLAALIAAKVCSKDRAAVQVMVRELMTDEDLGGVGIMLESLQDGIKMCKALAEVLEAAQSRLFIGAAEIATA